jgi:HlyD family secretion protein
VKRWLPVVALAGVAVLGTSLVLVRAGEDATTVQVAEVVRTSVTEVVEAPGNVAARATATLSAPADAVVEAVLVQDGESVTSGQVLVRLASESAQERLRAAETAAANARAARVEIPRSDLSPVQDGLDAAAHASFEAGRTAAAHVQDPELRAEAERRVADAERQYQASAHAARTAVAQANAGLGSIEQALDAIGGAQRAQAAAGVTSARNVLEALTVRAPIDGVVTLGGGAAPAGGAGGGGLGDLVGQLPGELQGQAEQLLGGGGSPGAPQTSSIGLSVGQAVSSGSPLLTVTDVSGLQVVAEVDETDVLLVQPGVAAVVELDAVPGATYAAGVTSVDVTPTTSARGGVSYRVRLELGAGQRPGDDAPAPTPRPGMSAVVDLQVRSSAPQSLAVPSSAVLRDGAEDAVLVLEQGRVTRQVVVLGAEGEDRVEVLRGLEVGQRVVARDVDQLTDGQPVSV